MLFTLYSFQKQGTILEHYLFYYLFYNSVEPIGTTTTFNYILIKTEVSISVYKKQQSSLYNSQLI